ncbi:MAG: dipeptidyl aminopeptidase/acylaminoacyl peptidase [Colwellia sp.]|jgi:dipeptidyl aminopeptidase/acylaminoacyl peptidase
MNLIKVIFIGTLLLTYFLTFNLLAKSFENPTDNVVKDFFRAQKVSSAKVNLSGNFIAMKEQTGKSFSIVIVDTQKYKKFVIYKNSRSNNSLVNYHWIDEQNIVLELYVNGKGRTLTALELTFVDNSVTAVNKRFLVENAFVENPLPHVKNKLLVSRIYKNGLSVYTVDLSKGSIEGQLRSKYRLNKKAPNSKQWLSDNDGNLNVGFGYDEKEKTNNVWLRQADKNKWDLIWQGNDEDTFEPVLLSEDRTKLFVISNEKDDVNTLYLYDLESKSYGDKVYKIDGVDLESAILSFDKKEVIGVSYTKNGMANYEYFNKLESSLDKVLEQSFIDLNPYIVDFNADKNIFIVQTSNSTDPGTFHIFKTKTWELVKFASRSPWLNKYKLQQSQLIKSNSVDGLQIESYLTLPAKSTLNGNKKPPLIVVPHGGPISVRDNMHFNAHVQFLAISGYAVLQPNYRGSFGYGKKFKQKGMQQWGKLIEDDIDTAVNQVIEGNFVDANKICIYGVSYGGYSALISAVRGSKLYKCSASYAGVTDLPLLFNDRAISESERIKKMMINIVGDPDDGMDELIAQSPVYQVEKINIPIFLAQGTDDTRVDIEHFYRMKKTLSHFKKDFKSLVLDNEGHGFTYIDNLVKFYSELNGFFNSSLELKSDYIRLLENAALSGDENAQNQLGFAYEKGKQITKSYVDALYWYEKAASQNMPVAQHNAGLIYDYGRGVEQDFIKARLWYEKSAEGGYARAYTFLAYLYENGQGVEQDYQKAHSLFEKSVELGYLFAWSRLARLYEKGLGVDINIGKAIEYYEKSNTKYGKKRSEILNQKS